MKVLLLFGEWWMVLEYS